MFIKLFILHAFFIFSCMCNNNHKTSENVKHRHKKNLVSGATDVYMCDKTSCDKLTDFYIAEDYVNNCYDKNIPIDFDVVTYHKSNGTFTKEPSFGFLKPFGIDNSLAREQEKGKLCRIVKR